MRTALATLVIALSLVVSLAAAPPTAAVDIAAGGTKAGAGDLVEAAIVQAVRDRMGTDARVAVDGVDVVGPRVEPPIVAVPSPGARVGGPIRFQLVGAGRGRTTRALGWATATVHVAVEHVRARHLVSRGKTLSEDDVEVSREAVAGVPLRRLPRLHEVYGAPALTALSPGGVLTKSAVAARPAVKSGQTVRATARIGGVHVMAELVAVQDGEPGATVRVVNKESRRELRARVLEPGLVEVINE